MTSTDTTKVMIFGAIASFFLGVLCYLWGSRYPNYVTVISSETLFVSNLLIIVFALTIFAVLTVITWILEE